MLSLSVRPAFTQTPWTYTRLKPRSPKRAFIRSGTFVQAELPLSYLNHPVQRSLAPQRVMLSHRITAYYDLIRASLPLPPVYVLSSGSLPVGLLRAAEEKVPNLSCLSFPIVPSSVPRRLGDFFGLLLHRSLWPSPSLQKVGARVSTLAGPMRGLRNEAAKFASCYGPMELLALLRQGHLHSSFHLLGHPSGMSSITTRANNQFPRPDLHRLDEQPYRLHTEHAEERVVDQMILRTPRLCGAILFGWGFAALSDEHRGLGNAEETTTLIKIYFRMTNTEVKTCKQQQRK